MRRDADGNSPGTNFIADLPNPELSIQVHEINRELHAYRVHRFARHDPQAAARGQAFAAKQSLIALRAGIRYFELSS